MKKKQFISSLHQALSPLNPSTVTEILADFEEHFAAGMAHGKTEQAIAAELGDPAAIARQYIEATADGEPSSLQNGTIPIDSYPPANDSMSSGNDMQAPQSVKAARINASGLVGVVLLNIFIGIPLWLTLFSLLTGFWAGAGSIGAAAVVLFVLAVFQAGVISLILMLFGLSLVSLSILCIVLLVYLTRWLIMGLRAWIKWNRRLVIGGKTL